MKTIEKLSFNCANYLTQQLGHNHQKRAILYFGFQAIYGDMSKLFVLIVISLLAGSFLPTMVIAFSFAYLRRNAGGFHMKSEIGCVLFTACICVIPGTLISNFSSQSGFLSMLYLVSTFIFCYICLLKYAPKGTINNQIQDKMEILKYKKKSIMSYALLYFCVVISFSIFDQYKISISISTGCLLEILTILPLQFIEPIKKIK